MNIGSEFRGTGYYLNGIMHENSNGNVRPLPLAEYYNYIHPMDNVGYLETATGPRIPSADASRAATVIEHFRQHVLLLDPPDVDLSYLSCVPPTSGFQQTPVICPLPPETFTVHDEFHLDSVIYVLNWFKETGQINGLTYICWVKFLTEQLTSVTSDDEDSDVMDSDDDGSDSMSMDLDRSEPFGAGDKTPTSNMVVEELTGKFTPDHSCKKCPPIDDNEGDDLAFLLS